MRKPHPVAIACSDIHLSDKQPVCRADDDWFETMAFYLRQLREAGEKYKVPILCAGDIFDKWNASNRLVNLALRELPDGMICIPGQHDLPAHNLNDVDRSAYGVLVEAGKIKDVSDPNWYWKNWKDDSETRKWEGFIGFGGHGFFLRPFAWGIEVVPNSYRSYTMDKGKRTPLEEGKRHLQIALIHKYVWTKGKSYPGAPEENQVAALKKNLKGYDVAVTGDNHSGFLAKAGDCTVLNCGGFMRRKSDEIEYQPKIGIIYSDGSVKRKSLDTSIDKFHENPKKREEQSFDLSEFLEGLESLGEEGLDFVQSLRNHLTGDNELEEGVKKKILEYIDNE